MRAESAPFEPPFCPATDCPCHHSGRAWRYRRIGFYTRQAPPSRIQRYQCRHCRRRFSTQTFSTTYWLRRPELLLPIAHRILGCSGFRQIAREFRVSPQTVLGQVARLGRHALLFQHHHRPRGPLGEPLALDGFESFEFSQYHPCHFHLVAGRTSHFFYAFTDSELRRKGRMTDRQRRRRAQLEARFGRPAPGTLPGDVAQALALAVPDPQPLTLHSDDHPAYPAARRRLPHYRIAHHVTPGAARRTPRNPLFEVNLLDLLIRHGSANHKRETLAFSKRRQSAAERLALFQVWRNFVKCFSERARDRTPAQRLGLCAQPLSLEAVFAHRLLPSRVRLPERLERYYRRAIVTRRIPRGRTHRLRYAD
ncbi:MAG: transposase [Candidatus Eiseniibacteriota bacterium]